MTTGTAHYVYSILSYYNTKKKPFHNTAVLLNSTLLQDLSGQLVNVNCHDTAIQRIRNVKRLNHDKYNFR